MSRKRKQNRWCPTVISVERLEPRQLLTAVDRPVISALIYPQNRDPLEPNTVRLDGELSATVRMVNSNESSRASRGIEYWFDDVTTSEHGVRIGRSKNSWFTVPAESFNSGHVYRVFVREAGGTNKGPGVWSPGIAFLIGNNPMVRAPGEGLYVQHAGSGALTAGHQLPISIGVVLVPHTFIPLNSVPGVPVPPTPGPQSATSDYYVGSYELELYTTGSSQVLLTASHTAVDYDGTPDYFTIENSTIDLLEPGEYSVRARTRYSLSGDPNVTNSEWSAFQTFTVHPAPVDIVAGVGDTADATPTIVWKTVDGASSYELWVSRRGESRAIYRQTGIEGSLHRIVQTLPRGEYTVWVRSHFANGSKSVWGNGVPVNVGVRPVLADDGHVTVFWSPVSLATRYEVWIDYLGGETSPQPRFIHNSNHFATTHTLPPDAPAGTYRVWIRAIRSEAGEHYLGFWSLPLDLTVASTEEGLEQPELLVNSAVNCQVGLEGETSRRSSTPEARETDRSDSGDRFA